MDLKNLDKKFDRFYEMIKYTGGGKKFNEINPEWELKRSRCLTERCIKNLYEKLTKDALNILLEQNPNYKQMREECRTLNIPPECEVYAFDANGTGLNIDYAEFAIDENYETHVKNIRVNRPEKCVVLALSSFEPTVWKIHYTPDTKIYGVILAYDDDNQMLQGVPVGTKVWRNQCLKGSVREAFLSGLADNNVVETKNTYIGARLPDERYMHQARNIDVTAKIQQELPNHEGVGFLVKNGVLRPVDEKDAAFLIDRGYSAIDKWMPVDFTHWKNVRSGCKDALRFSHSSECHYYILEKPLEKLPRGLSGVYGIVVFVPEKMTPPEKHGTTSSIMRMHAGLEELNNYRRKKE